MTRRDILAAGAASAWLSASRSWAQQSPKPMQNFGGAPAGFPIRARAGRGGAKPFDFVEYCHGLGLGVVETRLPPNNPEAIAAFRQKIESYNMRVILDVGYPRNEAGVAAFDASVKAAKECGAFSLHAAMTGRRYEDFTTLADFKRSFEQNQQSIALAEPVLRKYRMRLGMENHKGWRSAEQAAWLKRVSSEWVGVHFDFGNNVSLCEDPRETLQNLLPYAVACHIKDMAVAPYEDGFLLSEVPLGQGFLDIEGMVATLRKKDPDMPFDFEIITREPLRIPVFTDKYWATFDDAYSPLPGRDLARTLEVVRRSKKPLPTTAGLAADAQLRLEDQQVAESVAYARMKLT